MNPKQGDFLKSKTSIRISTIDCRTRQIIGMLELCENELCEIKDVQLYPRFIMLVECRGKLLGFSLIDLDEQEYSFYQQIFKNYTVNKNDIRKEKLIKINKIIEL